MRKNFEFENIPAFDAIKRFQDYYENSPMMIAIQELQKTMDAVNVPLDGVTTAVQTFRNAIEPIDNITRNINQLYEPILQISRDYEPLFNDSMISTLKSSLSTLKMFEGLDFSALKSVADALPDYELISSKLVHQIDFENMAKLRDDGEITDEEIAEEIEDIIKNKRFTFVETWDKIKKSKWFLAMRCILVILAFFGKPVIDKVHEETLEAMGVTKFWENTGIYETLDSLFGKEDNQRVATEDEAKATVDESKTGNISKQKREDLLSKVKDIRSFISNAPQDENTGNLLSYLSEIEKDINGKKYGLVFEEHREDIDEVLETHTPVLTEETDLFIDNGGQMNFLIEGDNLASLKLLEKTHKGQIDLIYIDPPYNTGGTDFRYDDTVIGKDDSFRHSKWLSFMTKRLKIAKNLLSENGIIFISIDENEQASLKMLCDELFSQDNHIETVIWKNKYGAGAKTVGFITVHEYVLCYSKTPIKDLTSELDKDGQAEYKKKDEKYEKRGGYLTQPLMTKSLGDRPNLVYNIEYNGDTIVPRKQWVWSRERLLTAISNNEVEFNKKKDGSYSVRAKKYLIDENGNMRRGKPLSILNGPFTQDGTKEIDKSIFERTNSITSKSSSLSCCISTSFDISFTQHEIICSLLSLIRSVFIIYRPATRFPITSLSNFTKR